MLESEYSLALLDALLISLEAFEDLTGKEYAIYFIGIFSRFSKIFTYHSNRYTWSYFHSLGLKHWREMNVLLAATTTTN